MSKPVKISAAYVGYVPTWPKGSIQVPETVVNIDAETGDVTLEDGTPIGRVRKGTRTYSPPTHKGSRIVKYHKQVPEWHGWYADRTYGRPDERRDTRKEVLEYLIAAHIGAQRTAAADE